VPIPITFRVVNAREFESLLKGWRGEIRDWRRIWPKVSRFLEGLEKRQFESQGGAGEHGEWDPLTEDYAKAKAKKYGEQPILRANGRLARSLTDSSSGDAVRIYQKLSMTFGSSLPYAGYHQAGYRKSHLGRYGLLGTVVDRTFGVPKRRKKFADASDRVPARRPIDLTRADFDALMQVVMKASANAAVRWGFAASKSFGLGITDPGQARLLGQGMMVGDYMGLGGS
jgi:phage gpG-like protein